MSTQFSSIAQSMLGVIVTNTWPSKSSYIAGWHICDALGVDRNHLDCSIPATEYDLALKELIDAGIVEEVPDLGCRYRLVEKAKNPSAQEKTITVEMTATEGVYLIEAITARLEALKDLPRTAATLQEARALMAFTERMTPKVQEKARQGL